MRKSIPDDHKFSSQWLNTVISYAAKQLGRVGGVKSPVGGFCSQQSRMELWPGGKKPDGLWLASKYYDKALTLLQKALEEQRHWSDHDSEISSDARTDTIADSGDSPEVVRSQRSRHRPRTSDELLAATAILCEFEAMDANGGAWSRHLTGTKSLLDVAEVGMQPSDGIPDAQDQVKFAGARKAIFWNFARQDFGAACKSKLPKNSVHTSYSKSTYLCGTMLKAMCKVSLQFFLNLSESRC